MRVTVPGVGLHHGVGLNRATTDHAEALTASQVLTFRAGGSGSGSRGWNRQMIVDALCYEITFYGVVVGGLIVVRPAWDHFHIVRIWVEPAYQGRGIGSRALALLEASHRQATLWTVEAAAEADRCRGFFERNGYHRACEADGAVRFQKRRPPILRLRSLPQRNGSR
jgi:ribosomal protein S18 acetylase RimI-like enzyme